MLLRIILLISGLSVAWMIGAISISPSFGPATNFGKFGVLRGALFAGIFGFLGATLQGGKVAETIGSGLLTGPELPLTIGTLILLVSAILISIGVITHIPIPTVFVVVGSVLGAGLALDQAWNITRIRTLAVVWIATPFIALILSFMISRILRRYVEKGRREKAILGNILIAVGMFSAYAGGANKIGLAIGLVSANFDIFLPLLLGVGGLSILLGAWLGGPRIVSAVSKDYSELGVRRAISALASAGILAQVATLLGIPVSLNEAIIGSVIGSGLAAGIGKVQGEKIIKTFLEWIAAFFASMILIFILVYSLF